MLTGCSQVMYGKLLLRIKLNYIGKTLHPRAGDLRGGDLDPHGHIHISCPSVVRVLRVYYKCGQTQTNLTVCHGVGRVSLGMVLSRATQMTYSEHYEVNDL